MILKSVIKKYKERSIALVRTIGFIDVFFKNQWLSWSFLVFFSLIL